jgi:hypothetical protein
MTLEIADKIHNFHPYFDGFSATNYFRDIDSSLALQSTFRTGNMTMFAVGRPTSAGSGRIVGISNIDLMGDSP